MKAEVNQASHTVTTSEFEGPLALLLELVEHGRLEVTAISIATITAEYLQRIQTLEDQQPENLSEFLQLGARLLYVKSLALLPRESAEEQVEELRQLNLELEEYRRYQQAARTLAKLSAQSSWQRSEVSRLKPSELPLPDLSLTELAEAFERALRRTEPAPSPGILRPHISQEAVMETLRKRLTRGSVELHTLLDSARNRLEVIVTFLAVLELVKSADLRVIQANQFSPIILEPAHV